MLVIEQLLARFDQQTDNLSHELTASRTSRFVYSLGELLFDLSFASNQVTCFKSLSSGLASCKKQSGRGLIDHTGTYRCSECGQADFGWLVGCSHGQFTDYSLTDRIEWRPGCIIGINHICQFTFVTSGSERDIDWKFTEERNLELLRFLPRTTFAKNIICLAAIRALNAVL